MADDRCIHTQYENRFTANRNKHLWKYVLATVVNCNFATLLKYYSRKPQLAEAVCVSMSTSEREKERKRERQKSKFDFMFHAVWNIAPTNI